VEQAGARANPSKLSAEQLDLDAERSELYVPRIRLAD